MSKENEQRVLDFMDCWRTHDLEGLMARIADDAVYTPDLVSQSITGREAIRKEWASYIDRMPWYELVVRNMASTGNLVFFEREERFRFPDDKPMVTNIVRLVGIYEFNDAGLITAFRDYYDTSVYKPPQPTAKA